MSAFYDILFLLGGLGMFLYGMRIMGDGLKSNSGSAMKAVLAKVTNKPAMGFLLGCLVTAMIQSSHATIVLTVGLVGAGFLTFRQSVGIIMGANVGTAITAQIIRLMDVDAGSGSIMNLLKSKNLASMALIAGIIMIMFVNSRSSKSVGTILMGFGILFIGLMNMSDAVSGMKDTVNTLLLSFNDNYFLGFLTGVGVTAVIQSSSAVVGIIQTIASSVGVQFCSVFAVIIGVNIGDCLTAFLVCRIGATKEQTRTALVHVIYNIFAAILIVTLLVILRTTGVLDDTFWFRTLNSGGVANVHGLFRLIPSICLLPFANRMADIAERVVPQGETDDEESDIEKNLRELDMHLITNPGVALSESEHLIGHMADVSVKNFTATSRQFFEFKEKRAGKILSREDLLDRMADSCNKYIVAVSPYITREVDNRSASFQLHALTCFERIGDLAININDSVIKLHEANQVFSGIAQQEVRIAFDAIREILTLTVNAYKTNDASMARLVEPLEEVIDELIEDLRGRHVHRMTHAECDIFNGIEYQNMLGNLERISDQCSDLAVYLLGRSDDSISGKEHTDIHNLHHSQDEEYLNEFQTNYERYFGRLNSIPVTKSDMDMAAPVEGVPVILPSETKTASDPVREEKDLDDR